MTTKTPTRTIVPPPADSRVIPHYIDVPPELEAPAEAVRAAIVRARLAQREHNLAAKAYEAADNIDRRAAAEAGPDHLPEPTKPQRYRELQEAKAKDSAAQDAITIAARAQSAAIGPVIGEWAPRHEAQVRERVEKACEQTEALIETLSEIQSDVTLYDALRDYAAGNTRSPTGWHLEYRTSDVLSRQIDKAEAVLRGGAIMRDSIPYELPFLLAAVRVKADEWAIQREQDRMVARRAEILAELEQQGVKPVINAYRERIKAEGLYNNRLPMP